MSQSLTAWLPIWSDVAALLGGLAAVIGVPLLIWQIRTTDRSRRLDFLEARIVDMYLEADEIWHVDRVPSDPVDDAAVLKIRREIRALVSMTWLFGQRTRIAGRVPKGDLLRIIENDVALQLGMRQGFLKAWLAVNRDTSGGLAQQDVETLLEEIQRAKHFPPYDKLLEEQQ